MRVNLPWDLGARKKESKITEAIDEERNSIREENEKKNSRVSGKAVHPMSWLAVTFTTQEINSLILRDLNFGS